MNSSLDLLASDLKDAVVLANCLYKLLSLVDGEGHRLLEIDILSGLAGCNGDCSMPVVRSGDDDSVDILAGKKIVVIDIHGRSGLLKTFLLIVLGNDVLETVAFDVIDIATGNYQHIFHVDETAEKVVGLLTKSDETESDLVVGCGLFLWCCRHHCSRSYHCAGKSESRGFEEITSFHKK